MRLRTASFARAVTVLALASAGDAQAQQLTLERDVPPVKWEGCSAVAALSTAADAPAPVFLSQSAPAIVQPASPADSARIHAERLAADATEAAVLGDSEAALQLLTRATTLNPASHVISYRRARALEETGDTDEAVIEYCRYLTLHYADDRERVEQRIEELTRTDSSAVPSIAARAWIDAIAHADSGKLDDAVLGFSRTIEAAPHWGDAYYNRALTRVALGSRDSASADLRQYLALSPGAANFDDVLALLEALRGRAYDPATTLATGLVVPGLGHLTTDRPVTGLIVLGSAASAIAAGILIERVDVSCLAVPVNGRCPPDQVLREDVERPYLLPSIGVAAAIGILGAFDAWRSVRRRNAEPGALVRIGPDAHALLEVPDVRVGTDGVDVALIRLRF